MTEDFWKNKIKAFLHDPPDKSLRLSGHEERRNVLLQEMDLKFDVDAEFDFISASMQRIVPVSNGLWIDFHKTDKKEHPVLIHPISAKLKMYGETSDSVLGIKKMRTLQILDVFLTAEKTTLRKLIGLNSRETYFKIWRLFKDILKEELEKQLRSDMAMELVNLPADTRCPDHTIWDHLDTSSAICGAKKRGQLALLMFKISPVQNFIKNARKEKDLWAGSHLLSFLTFKAIKVIIDEFGPDAVIFPHLRGQPFFDKEYGHILGIDDESVREKLRVANIPNKFLAIVDFESVQSLRNKINDSINNALKKILDFSLKVFGNGINEHMRNFYRRQLLNYFNITVEAIPANIGELKKLIDNLPAHAKEKYERWLNLLEKSGYPQREFDLYSMMFELVEEIVGVESRKFEKFGDLEKEKCTLCGELEIIGNKETWENARKNIFGLFKENERLCPLCLIKRMYPLWIKSKWGIDVGFESVSEVALKKNNWLNNVEKFDIYKELISKLKNSRLRVLVNNERLINCELLYIENLSVKYLKDSFGITVSESVLEPIEDIIEEIYHRYGEPEKYYAILMMDGDNMGKLLMGDDMLTTDKYLHPAVLDYLSPDVKDAVSKTKRLITPATHSAISRALMHFSVNEVPKIVDDHRGELIYAGGDDALALLPIDSALQCAYEIRDLFGKDWDGWELIPARSMSAGILIVHYKHPLYDALDKARSLEKKAKDFGRNAVAVGHLTRSGSYNEVVFNWSIVPKLGRFVELIKNSEKGEEPRIARRMIYHVVQEIDLLPNDEGALKGFLKFELTRHYSGEDKKEEIENLTKEIIDLAKNIRVKLTKADFESLKEFLKMEIRESTLSIVNLRLLKLIDECNLTSENLEHNIRDALGDCLKVDDSRFYKELYGIVLKKQIKGLFILLKILVDCDAKLRGDSYENSDQA